MTAPKLKDISSSDLRSFVDDLHGYDATDQYSQDQANILSMELDEFVSALVEYSGQHRDDLAGCSIVAGFQLGRTFEIKAMARAMREGR